MSTPQKDRLGCGCGSGEVGRGTVGLLYLFLFPTWLAILVTRVPVSLEEIVRAQAFALRTQVTPHIRSSFSEQLL